MMEQTELNTCVTCNRLLCTGDADDEVLYRKDPFQSEVNADDSKRWLCGTCHYESGMDV